MIYKEQGSSSWQWMFLFGSLIQIGINVATLIMEWSRFSYAEGLITHTDHYTLWDYSQCTTSCNELDYSDVHCNATRTSIKALLITCVGVQLIVAILVCLDSCRDFIGDTCVSIPKLVSIGCGSAIPLYSLIGWTSDCHSIFQGITSARATSEVTTSLSWGWGLTLGNFVLGLLLVQTVLSIQVRKTGSSSLLTGSRL